MKRKLLFLAALAVSAFGLNANAQSFSGEQGKYYLQNVESGLYWGAANDWGTQASLVKTPEYVTLIPNGDGTYNLDSHISNGGNAHYFNGSYMDNAQPVPLTITEVGENYTIAYGTTYYGWDGASTVLSDKLTSDAEGALWKVISEAEMKASLDNATAENPVNATFLILDPGFGRNNTDASAWNAVFENEGNYKLGGTGNGENCGEAYHQNFSIKQSITAPAGVYKFTANGFYRQDGTDNENLPKFYINEEETVFPIRTGGEDNRVQATNAFANGLYAIDPMFVKVEEGDNNITIGAKLENNTNIWFAWDNFELTYYGADATIADVKFGDLIKQVDALREQATALKANENVSAPTAAKLESALSDSENIEENEEAYKTAIAALTVAVQQANKDIANKPAIDAMYEIINNTNVYTEEAYQTYKASADEYLAKYEEGTLTETLANPTSNLGWHVENPVSDFLISAWNETNYNWNSYHVNTWSIEGNTDGTNFGTPFIEYWTGSGGVLAAKTLEAEVENLSSGLYEVSAWVRIQKTDGKDEDAIKGITLSVNGGEPVEVTDGEKVGVFRLAEYKAVGTVGKDGKLKIAFDVNTENISWLAFKNVKYTKLPTPIALTNPAFDVNPDDVVTVTTQGYGKNIKGDQVAGLQEVEAWTRNPEEPNMAADGGSGYTGGVFAYGSTNQLNAKVAAPATDPEENADGVALGIAAVWTGTAQYTQNVTLPAGNYTITYPVYNGANNAKDITKNLFGFIADDGTEYLATEKRFTLNTWNDITVEFTLYQETTGKISIGYVAMDGGSGDAPHLFVDHVSVIQQSDVELADAQEHLLSKIEGLTPVGEGLFYYQTEEVAKAKAAIEAATTQKEIDAVEMPKKVLPVEGQAYAIANTKAEGNLSVGENITVQIDAVVYFTPVNGGYAISNEAGEYIFKTNTGSWDNYGLSNTTELAKAYVISVNPVEGGYTLDGANGSLGTDETETGSKVWADKGNGNGNYIWTIAEYVPTSYDVTVTEAGWATWVTPADIDFAGVEAYVVSTISDDDKVTAQLVAVETALEGTPVIIKAAQGTHTLAVTEEATEVGENLLEISVGGESEGIYVLANLGEEGEEVVGFYALEEGYSLPAGKVYLPYSAAGVKFIGFGDGNATGINGVENAANGVENAVIYNVAGQRVSNPTKGGIYIINGKKVLVK